MTVSATQNLGGRSQRCDVTFDVYSGHDFGNACNSLKGARRATTYGRVRFAPTMTRIGRHLIRHELELARIFTCIVLAHI